MAALYLETQLMRSLHGIQAPCLPCCELLWLGSQPGRREMPTHLPLIQACKTQPLGGTSTPIKPEVLHNEGELAEGQ